MRGNNKKYSLDEVKEIPDYIYSECIKKELFLDMNLKIDYNDVFKTINHRKYA